MKKAVPTKQRGGVKDRKKDRRSVAEYPTPQGVDGEELMDAIPTWTQPVEEGDWDEVGIFILHIFRIFRGLAFPSFPRRGLQ
jgi:hypothetical protein